jgi:hypothetical protein
LQKSNLYNPKMLKRDQKSKRMQQLGVTRTGAVLIFAAAAFLQSDGKASRKRARSVCKRRRFMRNGNAWQLHTSVWPCCTSPRAVYANRSCWQAADARSPASLSLPFHITILTHVGTWGCVTPGSPRYASRRGCRYCFSRRSSSQDPGWHHSCNA